MAADATGGTNPEETDSVTLRTFNSRDAAELAAAKLDANGIPCRIDSDDCAGMYPNLALARGVRLIVSAADAAAAAELLDDRSTVPDEVAEKSPMPVETQEGNSSGLLWIGIFIGLVLGIVLTMLFMGRVR
ncbi:MAG TPA: DUF2007 domain-containing protein, partial [Verrucomicrobiae bacterium]|nr:DUF2007 domain-containing protein [Verrucomicrobiae bacterium]